MFTLRCKRVLPLAAAITLSACGDDFVPFEGIFLSSLPFNFFSEDCGIHPNDDILADPGNPFAEIPVSDETAFDIRFGGGGPVGTYYAWGTNLAVGANGERQFYTAEALKGIFDEDLFSPGLRETVRSMAIRAFQAQLDFFPDATNFDRFGAKQFRYATSSFKSIVELGGEVNGDWVLVRTVDEGGMVTEEAILASNPITNPLEPQEEDDEG